MRVLVVEDSGPTRDLIVAALEEAGMTVTTAARLSTGIKQATAAEFDAIVLDLMLPDGDGLDLCRRLRAEGNTTPILCLTARAVSAFSTGGPATGPASLNSVTGFSSPSVAKMVYARASCTRFTEMP